MDIKNDITFIINQSKEIINRCSFCNNRYNEKFAKIFKFWELNNIPNLGNIKFICWKVWNDQLGDHQYKTIGLCYNKIQDCILPKFKNIIDKHNFNYNLLYNVCNKNSGKYNWVIDYNNEPYIRFDEIKSCAICDEKYFDSSKIQKIILENLLRKKSEFIINKTPDMIWFINENIPTGISLEETNIINDEIDLFKKEKNFNDILNVGFTYDTDITHDVEDLFEIKTNIYR